MTIHSNPGSKTSTQVIDRVMRLLDTLTAHSDPVSLKELGQRAELHPSTPYRILPDFLDRLAPGPLGDALARDCKPSQGGPVCR
ncbi:hypothetical protein BN2476_210064 [Paraburkholderia piptadeniae]|uniref:HTH iclR-type domain-containing protein n=1 Tax=Paraburkholderia piptadeniae TaxID=1701573 RepID=A0A1N7RVL7_9BURK|nr:hypothetical protein BN2476_210064 [Paraburkholderia piptadeniae]